MDIAKALNQIFPFKFSQINVVLELKEYKNIVSFIAQYKKEIVR